MVSRKPPDLPPLVALAFVADMKKYFAEDDGHKRDVIAVRQLHALKEYQGPRDKPLLLSDVPSERRLQREHEHRSGGHEPH